MEQMLSQVTDYDAEVVVLVVMFVLPPPLSFSSSCRVL